jgi:hypothetical protein
MNDTKKPRTAKTKTAYEAELHAGKRCADMIRGLSLESQRRVIANLHQHLDEATSAVVSPKASADPRQVVIPGAFRDANGTPVQPELV